MFGNSCAFNIAPARLLESAPELRAGVEGAMRGVTTIPPATANSTVLMPRAVAIRSCSPVWPSSPAFANQDEDGEPDGGSDLGTSGRDA